MHLCQPLSGTPFTEYTQTTFFKCFNNQAKQKKQLGGKFNDGASPLGVQK